MLSVSWHQCLHGVGFQHGLTLRVWARKLIEVNQNSFISYFTNYVRVNRRNAIAGMLKICTVFAKLDISVFGLLMYAVE